MTDEEAELLEVKIRVEARKLEAELVPLREYFWHYCDTLDAANDSISKFLADPSGTFPSGRLKVDRINDLQRELSAHGFFDNAAEFLEKTKRLRELQERIKEFERGH